MCLLKVSAWPTIIRMIPLVIALALASSPAPPSRLTMADRRAILNVLRQPLEADLGKPVVFAVTELRSRAGWAFIQAEPQRPEGNPINGRAYFRERWADMDGLTTTAILRKRGARWQIVELRVGALDAWYCSYPPAQPFDPCRR